MKRGYARAMQLVESGMGCGESQQDTVGGTVGGGVLTGHWGRFYQALYEWVLR